MRRIACGLVLASLLGCATVNPADTEAWVGQPVLLLEKQPYFISMRVVKTQASDGTEIWNYVNGRDVSVCNQDGTIWGHRVGWGTYMGFADCTSHYSSCNNIFYIRDGRVQRVVVQSNGGAQCSTDKRFLPTYTG